MIRAGGLAVLLFAVAGQGAFAGCSDGRAEFRWDGGHARFSVEIADDEAERAQGLMFRQELRPSAGMLFIYERPQAVSFWMKNTLIPLDMVFVRADGVIHRIEVRTEPMSERIISSEGPVAAVLELAGDYAAWHRAATSWIDPSARADVFEAVARRVYRV